jgi:hypothetical protein
MPPHNCPKLRQDDQVFISKIPIPKGIGHMGCPQQGGMTQEEPAPVSLG